MRTITLDEVVEAAEWAVEQRGEGWVYPKIGGSCHYRWTADDIHNLSAMGMTVTEGTAACLVGAVLDRLNLLDDIVGEASEEDVDGQRWWHYNEEPVITLMDEARVVGTALFEVDAGTFLTETQNAQDGQCTWGVSLRRARSAVGLPLVSPSNREVGHDVPVPSPVAW
jgi:hypothetical protein